MRTLFPRLRRARSTGRRAPHLAQRPALERLDDRCLLSAGTGYIEANLVSDMRGLAHHTNRELVNPWGLSVNSKGQFRVSANGPGIAISLNAKGAKQGQDIIIPPPAGSPKGTTATPNGVASNTTSGFVISSHGRSAPATLLFSTEDGTITGWNKKKAVIGADQSGNGSVYKGLALGAVNGANYIYAANFHNGTVDVFDTNFKLVHLAGSFSDPNLPTGFAPFNIDNIGGTLFVTYAKQNAEMHDDVAGPGNGFIDEFDTSGHLLKRFASQGSLNSPWGMAVAPGNFGSFSNDLLVGNFGDSHVNAFNLGTGAFLGQLADTNGNSLVLNGGFQGSDTKGLWGIGFGNGAHGAATNTLFFASGINDEKDGLFGMVTADGSGHAAASAARHFDRTRPM